MNYVILIETSEEKKETWYYFIQLEGNKENLTYLEQQLNSVDWTMSGSLNFLIKKI